MIIEQHKCLRCGHEWWPRTNNNPKQCANPKCHSPYWNRPRKQKTSIEYPNHHILKNNRLKKLESVNHKCEICGLKATEVHHRDNTKTNHEIANLMSMCRKCHINNYHRKGRGWGRKKGGANRYFKHGKSIKEIAKIAGCHYNTAQLHLSGSKISTRHGNAIDKAAQSGDSTRHWK